MIERPSAAEHHSYYAPYVARVVEDDVMAVLESELEPTVALFRELREDQVRFRYAEGKWSVAELLGHLVDSERIFCTRALCIARGETAPLPGFDENAYVAHGAFDARPVASLLEEFEAVRRATLTLFAGMDATQLQRRGVANGNPMSARAVPWILAGHARHHLVVLRERYLPHFDR